MDWAVQLQLDCQFVLHKVFPSDGWPWLNVMVIGVLVYWTFLFLFGYSTYCFAIDLLLFFVHFSGWIDGVVRQQRKTARWYEVNECKNWTGVRLTITMFPLIGVCFSVSVLYNTVILTPLFIFFTTKFAPACFSFHWRFVQFHGNRGKFAFVHGDCSQFVSGLSCGSSPIAL